ncbi:hypothetical protein BMS3Abin03_02086 [bacterium BMS3Abin03]|nr:hypothetical protein BMS3Abin03_02086 [bacterium BMS3Abin03]
MKLNIKAFGLTCGILWGLTILIITLWILIIGSQGRILSKLSTFYFGYSISAGGAIIGLIWGFVDGLIGGAIFAWLYNKLTGTKQSE